MTDQTTVSAEEVARMRAVLDEVRPGERVLDMGTGSAAGAVLAAAEKGADVTAVDVGPQAVGAAREGDLFAEVEGCFDLVVLDPPSRWMRSRDQAEASTPDEDDRSLTAFFAHVRAHLEEDGRILVFLDATADIGHLEQLIEGNGLAGKIVSGPGADEGDHRVEHRTYRIEVADLALPWGVAGA